MLIWSRFFAVTVLALFVGFGGLTYGRLLLDHVETTGTIREWQPKNHNAVVVAYAVGGREFTVSGPNPGTDPPTIGSTLKVYYSPSDPMLATVGQPSLAFASGLMFAVVASALVAVVATASWNRMRGKSAPD